MIYTYDETTGGAKRIDWDLTGFDLTKDEDKELETLIRKFLANKVFANDIEDIDYSLEIRVTGKWHDEYPDYGNLGEEFDTSELEEENVLTKLLDLVLNDGAYQKTPQFRNKYFRTLKRMQSKLTGVY